MHDKNHFGQNLLESIGINLQKEAYTILVGKFKEMYPDCDEKFVKK